MTTRSVASWIVALVVAGAAVASAAAEAGTEALYSELGIDRLARPKSAPQLALPDLTGRTVRLADLRGRVVLLGFFTTT